MGSFLDRLREKNKNAKHVGIPPVTNPKLPTKVERDATAFTARVKSMPNFRFGSGHPTPTYADPKFNNASGSNSGPGISKVERDAFNAEYAAYVRLKREREKANNADSDKKVGE